MALFDFLFNRGTKAKGEKIPVFSEIATQVYNRLMPDKSDNELYRGWVYSAVNAIAEQYAIIDLRLNKYSGGKKEQVHEHPALSLLDYVSPMFTKYDLFFNTSAHLELNGKYYWIVLPNGLGEPAEIILPDPNRIKPVVDEYGLITAYKYYVEGGAMFSLIDPNLVVPFRNFNPKNNLDGMSTLSAVRIAAETDEYAKTYNRNWFKNSARPDIVLKFENDLTSDQKDKLREEWRNRYAGVNNTGKMLIAPKGMTVETISPNHADMEYIEQRRFSREEILSIFRVPKTILGLTEEVNRASAEAAMYAFVAFTMMPKYRRAINALNEFYLPMFKGTEGMKFEFLNIPPEDPEALMVEITQGIAGGVYSVNDGRRKKGLPEIQGGDDVYLPFGLTPLGAPAQPKQISLPVIKSFDDSLNGSVKNAAIEIANALEKCLQCDIEEETMPPKSNSKPELDNPEFEQKGESRAKDKDEMLKPFEEKFFKTSQQLFKDQEKRAIDAIKRQKSITDNARAKWNVKKSDILNENLEIKLTIDLFAPIFKELLETAGQEALRYIGSEEDFSVESASDFIKKNTLRFAKEVTTKTVNDIRNLVAVGVEQGESINQITARISTYSGFSEARSETIARTESIRGAANADVEAWKQSDLVSSMVWYTALDERVDDFCMYLHGTEIDLGAEFMSVNELTEFGVQPYGGSLDFPPAHPNCRCTLIPKLK